MWRWIPLCSPIFPEGDNSWIDGSSTPRCSVTFSRDLSTSSLYVQRFRRPREEERCDTAACALPVFFCPSLNPVDTSPNTHTTYVVLLPCIFHVVGVENVARRSPVSKSPLPLPPLPAMALHCARGAEQPRALSCTPSNSLQLKNVNKKTDLHALALEPAIQE